MENTVVTISMEAGLKEQVEELFDEMGLSMTTAITLFAKAVVQQRKIPFEITAPDPFYNTVNQEHLRKAIADLEAGRGKAHDLIEVDDVQNLAG